MKRIKNVGFYKNVGMLFSSSMLAQGFSFLILPLLARLYSPNEFGELALFSRFVSIGAVIAGLNLSTAAVVEKDQKKAFGIINISFWLHWLVFIFFFILMLALKPQFINWFSLKGSALWLYSIPFVVFVFSFATTLADWNNREKKYKTISSNTIIQTFGSGIYKIIHPLVTKTIPMGLIIGQIFGHSISLIHYLIRFKQKIKFPQKSDFKLLKSYKSYPLYDMPATLVNIIMTSLPFIFLARYFGTNATGQFEYAYKFTHLPLAILSYSLSRVFFRELSLNAENKDKTRELSARLLKQLLVISLLPLLCFSLFSEFISQNLLGSDWSMSGKMMQIVIIPYIFTFITAPFSYSFQVYGKIHLALVLNFVVLILVALGFYFNYSSHLGLYNGLKSFSSILVISRIVYLILFFKWMGHKINIRKVIVISSIVLMAILYLYLMI